MSDKAEWKKAVHEVLNERDSIDRETHHVDHAWVQDKRKREQHIQIRRQAIWDRIAGTIGVAFLLGILGLIGAGIRHWFKA